MLDPKSVQRLIERSRPSGPLAGGGPFLFLAMIGILALLILFPTATPIPGGIIETVPWFFLGTVFLYSWWTARRQRERQTLLLDAVDAVQREDPTRAEDRLTRLLRHPLRNAIQRIEALLSLASTAALQKQFTSAQIVYEAVLAFGVRIPLLSTAAEIGLADALLQSEQLRDAVDRIGKLQRADLAGSARAEVELIALHREVLMGQTGEAVDQIGPRRDLFRKHLSTRAAYGYALFAAALHLADEQTRAACFWEDATLLVSEDKLVERFRVLEPITKRYTAAVCPL